ncbi:MAG: hypothetical protein GPJ54_20820 [Candidatus Heimdallarchaeota archaeon]|nr:hypothetical protein [Candidatus Heimdallarchaeota archaeon]
MILKELPKRILILLISGLIISLLYLILDLLGYIIVLGSIHLYVVGIILVIIATIDFTIQKINNIRTDQITKANSYGFSSYKEYKKGIHKGFSSDEEQSQAKVLGFNVLKAYQLVKDKGFENVEQMRDKWKEVFQQANVVLNDSIAKNVLDQLKTANTISDCETINNQVETIIRSLEHHRGSIKTIVELQIALIELEQNNKKHIFVDLSLDEIQKLNTQAGEQEKEITSYLEELIDTKNDRKQFLIDVHSIVEQANCSTIFEMQEIWDVNLSQSKEMIKQLSVEHTLSKINLLTSPNDLVDTKNNIEQKLQEAVTFNTKLKQDIKLQHGLVEVLQNDNKQIITDITVEKLVLLGKEMQNFLSDVENVKSSVAEAIDKKIKWFGPWNQLLELIQETREGAEVKLDIIVKTLKIEEEHTANLLLLLLDSNPELGKYYRLERTYVKGTDIGSLIEDLFHDFSSQEQSHIGKNV